MRKRKGMAVIAAIVMTAVMSLGGSLAATTTVGIKDGAAAVKVEETIVGFAGHEWWVIGDADGGVYSKADSVTLLSKNHNDDFGDTVFNLNGNNTYKDSTLQRKMESIANNFSVKERGKINDRTITSQGESDPIAGDDVENQKVWPLSGDEHWDIGKGMDYVRKYDKNYWLRSYSRLSSRDALFARAAGQTNLISHDVSHILAARPALNLNVTSVIFTSSAGQTGKAAATAGGGLVSVTSPDTTSTNNKIKYTFKDDSLKLGSASVSKVEANKVTVAYDGATEGKTLSVIAKEKSGSEQFYGKLSSSTAKEGVGSFVVPDNFSFSKYDLEVFVEEINGANESDFASTPKALDTTVKNMVAVSGGTGGGPHAPGTEVTLTADPAAAGERFKRWKISPEVTPIQDTSFENETITFTMPDKDVTAAAGYEYSLTVIGGSGSNYYAEDEEVTLTANPAAAGQRFKRWEISPEVTLTKGSLTSEEIGFNMPKKAVTATAVYEYNLTVTGGSGSDYYAEGEEVTITANQPGPGKYFKGWSISPEVTLTEGTNTSSIIKFDMPAHAVTATAEYEDMIVYPIKDGDNTGWTQGDQGGLIITSEGEHRKFTDVSVDGAMLDRQHYTVESGSTIVTLKASYLSTLSVGEHVMRIHFTDGYTETKFSIQAAQTDKPTPPTTDPVEPTTPANPPVQPGEPNPPVQGGTTTTTTVASVGASPKTGDNNRIWIMVSVMLGAGLLFMVTGIVKQSKSRTK